MKISIIVATYNSDKTLKETLQSIHSQLFQDWECIVVDGKSKDRTIEIVEEFEKIDLRFRHISEPDNGIYDAFNKGWRLAKGEWIYYLGSSDLLLPEGLEKLMSTNHRDAAIISGHVYAKMIDGVLKPGYSVDFTGSHQAKLTRRSVIEEFRGFDERFKLIADEDLIWKIKDAGYKLDIVDVFVAVFMMGGASSRFSSLFTFAKEYYCILKKYPHRVNHPLINVLKISMHDLGSIIYRRSRKILFG